MADNAVGMPLIDVPAGLPRNPRRARERTETYLALAAAAEADPSPETYRAAAMAAFDLHTAYGYIGSCEYGIVWHELADVGTALMERANAYIRAAVHAEYV